MTDLTITQEWLDEAFAAIAVVRDKVLPVAHAIAAVGELVDPADAAIIATVDLGVGKLFEILSRLQSTPTITVSDEQLRQETIDAWHKALHPAPAK